MAEVIQKEVAILGGGLAGLSLASELAGRNLSYVVVEKEESVGGLARTFRRNGFGYDIGGHCFHTNLPHVQQKFFDLLGDQVLRVMRKSTIMLNGRRINYPLTFRNAALSLGAARAMKVLGECLLRSIRSANGEETSFDQWVVRRFGITLFQIYFRPYTEKVWGMPCSHLSADWASQRIHLLNLSHAARSMFMRRSRLPQTNSVFFYYPQRGIGQIADSLARHSRRDDLILLNSEVERVEQVNEEWKHVHVKTTKNRDPVVIRARHIVSTIPLPEFVATLGPPPPPQIVNAARSLTYRSIVLVFLIVNRSKVTEDTWTYFPDRGLTFGRIHEPGNWSPELKQPGKTSLCMEVFCDAGDPSWEAKQEDLIGHVVEALERLNWITRKEVLTAEVRRIRQAYPAYQVGYREKVRQIRDYLQVLNRVYITGRTGSFVYQNMDKVWDGSIELGRRLMMN